MVINEHCIKKINITFIVYLNKLTNFTSYHKHLKILLSSNKGISLNGIGKHMSLQAMYNFSHVSNNFKVFNVTFTTMSPSWISANLWMNQLTYYVNMYDKC